MGPVILILNPAARRARPAAREALTRALHDAGDLVVCLTEKGGDATRFAEEHRDSGARAIVAAGGDGTITQVAAGLGEGSPALLPFPLGNANVFSRSLGWPADPLAAAAAVEAALSEPVRQGTVTPWEVETENSSALAMMNLGVGVDAHVVEWIEDRQALKRRIGQLGFALGAASALRKAGSQRIEVRSDDGPPVSAHSLIGALGSPWAWFGRRALDPLPDARHDGTLHWLSLSGGTLGVAGRVLSGRPAAGVGETVGAAAGQITVTSSEPVPVQADGEPLARSRTLTARPRGPMSVVLPA